MPSKEYRLNKIKELEFQRDIKINQDNRTHTTLIALLSIVTIFFIFELQNPGKSIYWIVGLGISFFSLMWIINKEIHYKENKKIQNEFDIILGRKK